MSINRLIAGMARGDKVDGVQRADEVPKVGPRADETQPTSPAPGPHPAPPEGEHGPTPPAKDDSSTTTPPPSLPHVEPNIPLTQEQHDLVNGAVTVDEPRNSGTIDANGHVVEGSLNATRDVQLDNGKSGIYKAQTGENPDLFTDTYDGMYNDFWRNEVGAFMVDKALGFDLVPTTAPFIGKEGIGSLQERVAGTKDEIATRDIGTYDQLDQQRMGVLDYVIGNSDRHGANWLTQQVDPSNAVALQSQSTTMRPAAIDNGQSFGAAPALGLIRSNWVVDQLYKPLDASVMSSVNSVDQGALSQQLKGLGISDEAVSRAMGRLNEIKTNGMITGQAFLDQHPMALKIGAATGELPFENFADVVKRAKPPT